MEGSVFYTAILLSFLYVTICFQADRGYFLKSTLKLCTCTWAELLSKYTKIGALFQNSKHLSRRQVVSHALRSVLRHPERERHSCGGDLQKADRWLCYLDWYSLDTAYIACTLSVLAVAKKGAVQD